MEMETNRTWMRDFWWTDAIALLVAISAIIRIFLKNEIYLKIDNTTLLYLCTVGALFLVKHAKSFKLGDMQIELNQLKEQVKENSLLVGIADDSSKLNSRNNIKNSKSFLVDPEEFKPGTQPDDPWKGVFGGKSISKKKGRVLTAKVVPLKFAPGWYSVELTVNTIPGFEPLNGEVQLFLHDSFPNNKPIIRAMEGVAMLRLKAWGAFTVGALADNGETKLELDLAELSTAPVEFRSR